MQIIRVTFTAACAIVLASCGIDKTELTMVLPTEAVDRSIVEELDAILDAGSSVGLQFTGESLAGEDALDAIAAGDADLALVSNYLPFRDDIATIMPLYPTVLHIGINKHSDDSSEFRLSAGAKVLAGPEGSASRIVFERIAKRVNLTPDDFNYIAPNSDIPDFVVVFTPITTENIEKIRDVRQWLPNFELASMGTPGDIGTGSIIDAAVMLAPSFRPFVIPTGTYGDLTDSPVVTVAVDKMIVARPDIDSTVVYDLINELVRLRPALAANRPGLFQALTGDFDASRSTYVLHAGTQAYLQRAAPSVYERYSGVAEVAVTAFVALGSMLVAGIRIFRMRRKNRIDRFYSDTIAIRRTITPSSSADEVQRAIEKIRQLQVTAFDLLVDEKLAADESFRIFVTLSNDVLRQLGDTDAAPLASDR